MTEPLQRHPFTHVSVSQMNTCDDCPLKWYFEKILKLPREEHDHFKFGTVLHACLERILQGEEPFPAGWDTDAPAGTSDMIRSLVEEGVEVGAVKPGPHDNCEVEYEFKIPLGPEYDDLLFVGFIDLLDISRFFPCVQDHKTVSGNKRAKTPEAVWGRYAKTVEGLKEDRQMLLYAWVALCLYKAKHGMLPSKGILLRHNQYLKRHRNDPVMGNKPRVRMVGGMNNMRSAATPEMIEAAWEEAQGLVKSMIQYAALPWQEVPQNRDSCSKFGGCDFRSICDDGVSPEDFAARQRAMNDLLSPLEPEEGAPMGLDALDALAGQSATPAPTSPATVTPPVDETQPALAHVHTCLTPDPSKAPPWAMIGCEACAQANAGAGFNQLGQPCMICVLDATDKGRPLPDGYQILPGPTWQPAADGTNGDLPPAEAGPAPSNQGGGDVDLKVDLGAALDAASAPQEPAQEPAPEEPQSEPAPSTAQEEQPSEPLDGATHPTSPPDFMDGKQSQYKKGELWEQIQALQAYVAGSAFTPQAQEAPAAEPAPAEETPTATGFTLAINCRPGPDDVTLHSLLYGPEPAWADAVCAALGKQGIHAPSWAGTDFFKRRDTLLGALSQLVPSLDGMTLFVSTGPAETRDAIEVLRLYADRVIEGE